MHLGASWGCQLQWSILEERLMVRQALPSLWPWRNAADFSRGAGFRWHRPCSAMPSEPRLTGLLNRASSYHGWNSGKRGRGPPAKIKMLTKSAGGVKLDEPVYWFGGGQPQAPATRDLPTNPQECFLYRWNWVPLTGETAVNASSSVSTKQQSWALPKSTPPKNSLSGLEAPDNTSKSLQTTIGEVLKKVFS